MMDTNGSLSWALQRRQNAPPILSDQPELDVTTSEALTMVEQLTQLHPHLGELGDAIGYLDARGEVITESWIRSSLQGHPDVADEPGRPVGGRRIRIYETCLVEVDVVPRPDVGGTQGDVLHSLEARRVPDEYADAPRRGLVPAIGTERGVLAHGREPPVTDRPLGLRIVQVGQGAYEAGCTDQPSPVDDRDALGVAGSLHRSDFRQCQRPAGGCA